MAPHAGTPDSRDDRQGYLMSKYVGVEDEEDDNSTSPIKNRKLATSSNNQPFLLATSNRRDGVIHHLGAWLPEIIWSILTIGLLIAIVAVLAHFDGKAMPKWALDLTLNTLLAFLATICRAMTVIPLAEAISQLKWNWFASHPRPLHDMYHFDQASRGPWGALLLLVKARGRFMSFAWVAALVFLSGLVTSFLTQSTIAYKKGFALAESSVALAPAIRSYPEALPEADGDDFNQGYGISRAAYQAALYTVNESWSMPQPSCSGIKCEWPQYSSLGICVSISNVTEHLNTTETWEVARNRTMRRAKLPDNLGLLDWIQNPYPIQLNMTSPSIGKSVTGKETNALREQWNSLTNWSNPDILSAAVAQYFFIFSNSNPEVSQKFRAVEVLWHFCVNTYESSFSNGTASTRTVSSTVKIGEMHDPGPENGEVYNSYSLQNEHGNSKFNVTATMLTYLAIRVNLQAYIKDTGRHMLFEMGNSPSFGEVMARNVFNGLAENSSDVDIDLKTWKNIQRMCNTIADGMTAYMLSTEKAKQVQGTTFREETYVHIRWEWLSFLAAQIGLTVLFLIAVMIQTTRLGMDVVKSSNTAELFALYGAEAKDEGRRHDPRPSDGLRYQGIKTEVQAASSGRLVKDKEYGWKLHLM